LKDDIFGLCWNLRLVTKIIIYLEGFGFLFFEDFWKSIIFCMVKYLSLHNNSSSFCLQILFFNVNGKAGVCVCVCVCVRERERERERLTHTLFLL